MEIQENITQNNNIGDCFLSTTAREKFISNASGRRRLIQFGLRYDLDDGENSSLADCKRIIFMIPGNPGEVLFYRDFMYLLHQNLKIPVLGFSHVGLSKQCPRSQKGPLTVRRLIEDLIELIERYIPKNVSIILVGHSIGSFIAKEIMRLSEDRNRYDHAVLLAPAIQKLGQTPGSWAVRALNCFSPLFYSVIFGLWLLPENTVTGLVRTAFRLMFDDYAECAVQSIVNTIHLPTIRTVLELASDEFWQVQDLDIKFIDRNSSRLSFVFAELDEWVPNSHYDDLKQLCPDAEAVIVPSTLHVFNFSKRMTDSFVEITCRYLEKYTNNPNVQ